MRIRKIARYRRAGNSWGEQAEQIVRDKLNGLPRDRFIVAHDIRFKYGNIDHLVIRVADRQVYLIETKSYRGRITAIGGRLLLNGRPLKRNPICQIQGSTRYLRGVLGNPWLVAILVMPFADIRAGAVIKRVNIASLRSMLHLLGHPGCQGGPTDKKRSTWSVGGSCTRR